MDLVVDLFFLFFFFFSSPFTSGIEKERKKKERLREKKYCGIFLRNAIYFLPFYFNDLDSLLWGVWWFRLLSRTGFLLFSLFFFFLAYCFMGFYFLFFNLFFFAFCIFSIKYFRQASFISVPTYALPTTSQISAFLFNLRFISSFFSVIFFYIAH